MLRIELSARARNTKKNLTHYLSMSAQQANNGIISFFGHSRLFVGLAISDFSLHEQRLFVHLFDSLNPMNTKKNNEDDYV